MHDILGLEPGKAYINYEDAESDAVSWVYVKGKASLDAGWEDIEKHIGFTRENAIGLLPADVMRNGKSAMLRNDGPFIDDKTGEHFAFYSYLDIEGEKNRPYYYRYSVFAGKENWASIYCFMEGEVLKYSYFVGEGNLLTKKDADENRTTGGAVRGSAEILKRKNANGHIIKSQITLVHSHLIDRINFSWFHIHNNKRIINNFHGSSVGNTDGLSGNLDGGAQVDGDINWANQNNKNIIAVEDNKKAHVYYFKTKKTKWINVK